MPKKLIGTLIGVFMGLMVLAPAAMGAKVGAKVGEWKIIGVFCNTQDISVIKKLTAAIEKRGFDGYIAFLRDRKNPCFDARLRQTRPIQVELIERMWTFRLPENNTLIAMWRIRDTGGNYGFTWFVVEGQDV